MAKQTRFVIPKTVRLPGGYKVKVRTLGLKAFKAEHGAIKAVCTFNESIELRADRTPAQRRADYAHELIHIVLDWQAQAMERSDVDPKG